MSYSPPPSRNTFAPLTVISSNDVNVNFATLRTLLAAIVPGANDASHASQRAGHRLAVVAPRDDAFGMTRMYQLLGEREDYHIGVFRTMAEVEAWLAAG